MKITTFALLAAAFVASLAGCSKHDNEITDNTWNGEIRLSSGITTQTRAIQDYQSTQLEAGNLVGVFINEQGGNTTTYTQNLEYHATGAGSFANAPTVYFPGSGNPVNIYAYAPYNAICSNLAGTYTFTVKPNQHSVANYIASDLLWGEPMSTGATPIKLINPVARTKDAINLHFRHLLSKVRVTLADGAGLTTEDVTKVEVLDLLPSIDLKMADGTISVAKGIKSDVLMADATYIEITNASAVVVPQTMANGSKFLRFGLKDGGELYYTLPKALTMESGKIYDYTITLNLTGLTVTSTVTDWVTGAVLEGGAEMPIGSKNPEQAAVGDFYFKDGSLADKDATLGSAQQAACIGIVFWKDPDNFGKGKIVSLKEAPRTEWSTEYVQTYSNSTADGRVNMAAIAQYIADNGKSWDAYPTFKWVAEQNGKPDGGWDATTDRWYLPAKEELQALYGAYNDDDTPQNRDVKVAVNRSLSKISSAAQLTGFYWSSSEYDDYPAYDAWVVSFDFGYVDNDRKYGGYYVRSVFAF